MKNMLCHTLLTAIFMLGCGGANKTAAEGDDVEKDTDAQTAADAQTDDIEFFGKTDPSVDVNAFKTYAWVAIEGALRDPESKWSAPDLNVPKELAFLVDRELRGRGMTEVTENPDVLVAYSVVVDMAAMEVLKDEDGNMDITANVPQSALFVAYVSPDTGEVVWVGAASGKVQENRTNESVKARLDYAVTNIIKTIGK